MLQVRDRQLLRADSAGVLRGFDSEHRLLRDESTGVLRDQDLSLGLSVRASGQSAWPGAQSAMR